VTPLTLLGGELLLYYLKATTTSLFFSASLLRIQDSACSHYIIKWCVTRVQNLYKGQSCKLNSARTDQTFPCSRYPISMSQHHVPEDIKVVGSSSAAGSDFDSDDLSSDSDKELMKFRAAVPPPWDNASIADLRQASGVSIFSGRITVSKLAIQALDTAQKLLLNL